MTMEAFAHSLERMYSIPRETQQQQQAEEARAQSTRPAETVPNRYPSDAYAATVTREQHSERYPPASSQHVPHYPVPVSHHDPRVAQYPAHAHSHPYPDQRQQGYAHTQPDGHQDQRQAHPDPYHQDYRTQYPNHRRYDAPRGAPSQYHDYPPQRYRESHPAAYQTPAGGYEAPADRPDPYRESYPEAQQQPAAAEVAPSADVLFSSRWETEPGEQSTLYTDRPFESPFAEVHTHTHTYIHT